VTCTVVVGGQWGDEAKGKIASYLALRDNVDVAVRAGLGPGAGHTVVHEGTSYKLRQVPSAMVNPETRLLLGAGVLIRPEVFLAEVAALGVGARVGVDYRATVIDDEHVAREHDDVTLSTVVRSTGSGHGPALAARVMRSARQAQDVPELKPYLADVAAEVNDAVDAGANVQVEGTNGFGLSVLFGTYPYTVGKDSSASATASDVGLGPLAVDEVVMVLRAFPTRVGAGPFPTEMSPEEAVRHGIVEYGTVTGRPRRVGRFDVDLARAALRVNRPSRIALTFLDHVDPNCRGHRGDVVPDGPAGEFATWVESELGRSIDLFGTGPDTVDVVDLRQRPEPPRTARADGGRRDGC
jgi:adenylosuccinate synthase